MSSEDVVKSAVDKFVGAADWNTQLSQDEAAELRKALIKKLCGKSSSYVRMTVEEKERRRLARLAARGNKPATYVKLDPREKEQRQLIRLIGHAGKVGISMGKIESWIKHGSNPSLRMEIFNRLREPAAGGIITWNDTMGRSFFYTPETWKEKLDDVPNT